MLIGPGGNSGPLPRGNLLFARRFSLLVSGFAAAAVTVAAAVVAPLSASAAITVVLSGIQYDPPGPDYRTNAQLNQEFFTIRNISSRPINLSGFRVLDVANHVFVFPRGYVLAGRTTAIVRTGKNRNRRADPVLEPGQLHLEQHRRHRPVPDTGRQDVRHLHLQGRHRPCPRRLLVPRHAPFRGSTPPMRWVAERLRCSAGRLTLHATRLV